MDPTETGKLIRKKRKVLSMTQQELAEKVFVEKATVSAWETGKIYPSMQSQMLLYQVLGVNPLELMTGRIMRDVLCAYVSPMESVGFSTHISFSLALACVAEHVALNNEGEYVFSGLVDCIHCSSVWVRLRTNAKYK